MIKKHKEVIKMYQRYCLKRGIHFMNQNVKTEKDILEQVKEIIGKK